MRTHESVRPRSSLAASITLPSVVLALAVILSLSSLAGAEVVRLEVVSRDVVTDWPTDSAAGPYEVITGIIHLEVAPDAPVNKRIVDLDLAPVNASGRVEFSTEFELHKPVDTNLSNRRLLYFVNNRGNRMGAGHFNYGTGGNWLYEGGWSYLWCGWNCDVPESETKFNITVPIATINGTTITGDVYAEMVNHGNDPVPSMPFTWGGSIPYPVVSMDNAEATLTMRQYRWDDPVEVPRDGWSFARSENGEVVPDPQHLYIEEGFRPGWLYDLVYKSSGSRITGLGMAAVRDVVSFFRYESGDTDGVPNPLAGSIEHAYAWGHSQSARLLNHFVYQDFNGDEDGRIVFDGIQASCAGAGKGQFNSRFAQTTRHGSHHEDNLYPIDFFPFASVKQTDPITRERGDNLALARRSGFLPRMFYINSSTDYWTRAASLLHTDVAGESDIEIDPSVRVYAVAGRAHVDDRMGFIGRALLTALDAWVSDGVEPPVSEVPRVDDGSLVGLAAFREAFPAVPGARLMDSLYHPYRLAPGARWETDGLADHVPPLLGSRYVCLVPQVDADGNELAGIRLPEVAVPLASFCGWSMRSASYSSTLKRNAGEVWPFAPTAAERESSGDPRLSVAERYPDADVYVARVAESLEELRGKRLLLDGDVERLMEQARLVSGYIGKPCPVADIIETDGIGAAAEYCTRLGEADLFAWCGGGPGDIAGRVNTRGYELMAAGDPTAARALFEFNTLLFPESANAWDSLGECCFDLKQYAEAGQFYEKSLELDPGNSHAADMLAEISQKQP